MSLGLLSDCTPCRVIIVALCNACIPGLRVIVGHVLIVVLSIIHHHGYGLQGCGNK